MLYVLIAISATISVAVLSDLIEVESQEMTRLGIDELGNPTCNCQNPDIPEEFGPEFCEELRDVDRSPICKDEKFSLTPQKLKNSEKIQGEGCDARFWKAVDGYGNSAFHTWPADYSADQRYNVVFNANIKKSDIAFEKIDVIPFEFLVDEVDEQKESERQEGEMIRIITSKENEAGPTLIESLYQHPESFLDEGKDDLVRESVVALLNAAHKDVDYPYSEYEVISITYDALGGGDYSQILNDLEEANNLHAKNICPENP